MSRIYLTDHAVQRAKERLSWNLLTLERLANRALNEGLTHDRVTGNLRKWVDKLYLEHKVANNIHIYGEVVYLFHYYTLVTLFVIPHDLKKIVKSTNSKLKNSSVH